MHDGHASRDRGRRHRGPSVSRHCRRARAAAPRCDGAGGYSSGPVVLAAAVRGIPTLLLEQNAVPGLTNRLLARIVSAAAVTFDATAGYFGSRAFVAGNPVRPEFVSDHPAPGTRTAGPPRLLRSEERRVGK